MGERSPADKNVLTVKQLLLESTLSSVPGNSTENVCVDMKDWWD